MCRQRMLCTYVFSFWRLISSFFVSCSRASYTTPPTYHIPYRVWIVYFLYSSIIFIYEGAVFCLPSFRGVRVFMRPSECGGGGPVEFLFCLVQEGTVLRPQKLEQGKMNSYDTKKKKSLGVTKQSCSIRMMPWRVSTFYVFVQTPAVQSPVEEHAQLSLFQKIRKRLPVFFSPKKYAPFTSK